MSKGSVSLYCHISPSGKMYVGISVNPEKRWANGKGYKKNYLFNRAIEKYGWENITHDIIVSGLTTEDAKDMEARLIKMLNLTDHNYGYNLKDGGDGPFSEESRNKMSRARMGNKNSFGKHPSLETKEKISKSLIRFYSSHDGTMKGKKHTKATIEKLCSRCVSDETRKKMRENHFDCSGSKNPSARKIAIIDSSGQIVKTYDYATIAARELNIDISGIIKCCKGKRKSCGGFKWAYYEKSEGCIT